MISAMHGASPLLFQAAAQDTVVMLVARDGLATVAGVANVVVSIVLLVLLGIITVLFFQLRKVALQLNAMMKRLEMDPLLDRSRRVAENVDFITLAIRSDVEMVNRSVAQLSDRLTQASDRMEERIADFNALMEVVQGEAEGVFVDTASTVRGVTAGARRLQEPHRRRPRPRREPAHDGVVIEVDEE
jgi:hypothetical protein